MKKTIVKTIILCTMILSLCGVCYAATFSPSITANSGSVGDTIDVNVSVPANTNAAGGSLNLVYDNTKMELVDAVAGNILSGFSTTVNKTYAENKVRITFASSNVISSDGGVILKATFKLTAEGTTTFSTENFKLADVDSNKLTCSDITSYTYTVEGESSEGDIKLSVGDGTGRAGDSVSVSVDISDNTDITGMILQLEYDSNLTLSGLAVGDALESLVFTPPADKSQNPCTLLWDGVDGDSTNGTILTLTFKIKDTASTGKYDIKLSYKTGDIYNSKLKNINAVISNGAITVIDYRLGDVNDDNFIDDKDVKALRGYISGDKAVNINAKAADVNKDSVINAKDITIIRRFISGNYGVELN